MLAARLLLITVINLARQQIEIKRRRLGATSTWPAERQDPKATPGTAQPQNAIREDRDFVWVTRQAVTAKRTTKRRKRRREEKKKSCVTTLLLSCS